MPKRGLSVCKLWQIVVGSARGGLPWGYFYCQLVRFLTNQEYLLKL